MAKPPIYLTPDAYAAMQRQGSGQLQGAQQSLDNTRHWTQALGDVLLGLGGQARMDMARQGETEASRAANARLAAMLTGDENALNAAIQDPRTAQAAFNYKLQAPQREFQAWQRQNAMENAPLERESMQLGNQAKRAQIAAANKPPQPKWMKVGRDSMGQDIYGWVDPATRQVIPQTLPGVSPAPTPNQGQATPGQPGPTFSVGDPPPGVDPAEYRKYASRKAADAVITARQAYPGVKGAVERTTAVIDGLLNNPSWDRSTGVISGLLPSVSEDAANFDQLLEQARGGAFVQAFQDIKGGGAITETEGRAATQALARLQSARVGSANFKKALQDFKSELIKLHKIAAWKAGFKFEQGQAQEGNQGSAPARRKFNPDTGRIE